MKYFVVPKDQMFNQMNAQLLCNFLRKNVTSDATMQGSTFNHSFIHKSCTGAVLSCIQTTSKYEEMWKVRAVVDLFIFLAYFDHVDDCQKFKIVCHAVNKIINLSNNGYKK
jgi:hypothetical protein